MIDIVLPNNRNETLKNVAASFIISDGDTRFRYLDNVGLNTGIYIVNTFMIVIRVLNKENL